MHSIGDRIRARRGKALTQKQLADAAGVSVAIIRKLEQGDRQTAAIGTLARIAQALDVELATLLGDPSAVPSSDPHAGIVGIRRALTSIDDLIGETADDERAVTLTEAERTVNYAWGVYWSGQYDTLAGMLPSVLPQLRATAHALGSNEGASAAELYARACWVSGCTLVHLGQPDTAWQAIRSGIDAAERGNDPLLSATLKGSASWQLLVQGRYAESERLATRTAHRIEPRGEAAPDHLSAYGSLVITAATAAGRDMRTGEAEHLVDQARDVADRMGTDRRDYETYFGPSQVVMQTVDVGVVTENYTRALDAAKAMPNGAGALPLASRCRHLADQAMAYSRLGHTRKALDALLAAESMGKDWIKHQTLPRRIISELLERDRQSRLRGLAKRLGVSG